MTATEPSLSPLERIRNRPPNQGTYTFAFDPNDATRIVDAQAVVRDAELDVQTHPKAPTSKNTLTKARAGLRAALDCVTVTLTLRSIGVAAVEQLQHDHPPTAEQLDALGEGQTLAADASTYAPAILAASLVSIVFSDDPDHPILELSDDDAAAFFDQLTQLDQLEILAMTNALNGRSSRVDAAGKG